MTARSYRNADTMISQARRTLVRHGFNAMPQCHVVLGYCSLKRFIPRIESVEAIGRPSAIKSKLVYINA